METTPAMPSASTAILVVEANALVRTMLRRALERQHRRVVLAANAESALALFEHSDEPIGLVVTEQQLAGMDGTTLADELRGRDPTIPILLVGSGFEGTPGEYPWLDRPFTLAKLEQRIRDALAAPSDVPAAGSRPSSRLHDSRPR